VEGGQLATERKLLRWQDLVVKTLDGCSTRAQEGHITVRNEVPENLPAIVGDEPALRMLLGNLVDNAIRYNRAGGHVSVSGESSSADQTVTLSVSDDGIGIASDQQAHVFDEFYRVRDGSTAGVNGTGMGLAICRKIAEELGGRITLTSQPGQGSTFSVVLPCHASQQPPEEPAEEAPIGGA